MVHTVRWNGVTLRNVSKIYNTGMLDGLNITNTGYSTQWYTFDNMAGTTKGVMRIV